jgi:hypothetical protein
MTWALAVAAILVAGCGGTLESRAPVATPSATTTPTEAPTAAPTAAASLVAGSIGYRVVNETNAPIDIYVRSQGVVRASLAKAALGPVEVTAELFPPEPGEIVILPAGAGDPTCVISCDFAAEASTNGGEGSHRIILVRGADSSEFWADPKPASVGTYANALRPADATQPLVIIEAGGVTDGKFGLRVSWGAGGCVEALGAAGLMLGGTNVLAYGMDPAGGALALHAGSDTDCSKAPLAAPITVAAAAKGSRTFVLAWGAAGAVKAVTLPLP